jgi:cation diffusion facilitator CzcD-associated flavoprotein CzcO
MRFPVPLQRAFATIPPLQRLARLATSVFMDLIFWRVWVNYRQVRWLGLGAEWLCRRHIRNQVRDPTLHEVLTPTYSWGCKRPSFSNDFYPIFNRDTVALVTAPIERVTSDAVITADGRRHPAEVIICATGYQPFEKGAFPPYTVIGRDGLSLHDYWDKNRYQAYRGFAVHGFPNYFMVFGPYSIANSSYFGNIECGARNIVRCMSAARAAGADFVEPTEEAQARELAQIHKAKAVTIWSVANCADSRTYYLDRFGDTPGFRHTYHPREWWDSRTKGTAGFRIERRPTARAHETRQA